MRQFRRKFLKLCSIRKPRLSFQMRCQISLETGSLTSVMPSIWTNKFCFSVTKCFSKGVLCWWKSFRDPKSRLFLRELCKNLTKFSEWNLRPPEMNLPKFTTYASALTKVRIPQFWRPKNLRESSDSCKRRKKRVDSRKCRTCTTIWWRRLKLKWWMWSRLCTSRVANSPQTSKIN